jgi:hypothetical protein
MGLWTTSARTTDLRQPHEMQTATALRYGGQVASLVSTQNSVATRPQLAALGISRGHIRNQIKAGRWRTEGHRVVVLHNGPLDEQQQRWAAVLGQAPGAALGGITAAQAHGLGWKSPESVHVIVPEGSRIVATQGIVVHASRTYDPARDRQPGGGPTRTRIERSVIDAASWTTSDRRACGVLCAAVQQRLVTVDPLLASLASAGPIRRRRLIGLTLGDIQGGAQSLLEIDFVALAAQAGIAPPRRQVVRIDAQGKRRYIDVVFEFFQVEVDGALHLLPSNYWDDMDRQNELTIGGSRLLRFSTVAIRLQPDRVISQLQRADERFRR